MKREREVLLKEWCLSHRKGEDRLRLSLPHYRKNLVGFNQPWIRSWLRIYLCLGRYHCCSSFPLRMRKYLARSKLMEVKWRRCTSVSHISLWEKRTRSHWIRLSTTKVKFILPNGFMTQFRHRRDSPDNTTSSPQSRKIKPSSYLLMQQRKNLSTQ